MGKYTRGHHAITNMPNTLTMLINEKILSKNPESAASQTRAETHGSHLHSLPTQNWMWTSTRIMDPILNHDHRLHQEAQPSAPGRRHGRDLALQPQQDGPTQTTTLTTLTLTHICTRYTPMYNQPISQHFTYIRHREDTTRRIFENNNHI